MTSLLYQATIEHGEAVEDQLVEGNLELLRTQKGLSEELTEAANYILSILPEPRRASPSTQWLLVPSTELGGDSFGHQEIDDNHIAFYLLVVCGHGVGAALLSVTAINVLRSAALPRTVFRDPGAVPGIAVGMMPDMFYRTAACTISPGYRLHLVSDGTYEMETGTGEMLEFRNFVDGQGRSASPGEVLEWVRELNGPGPLPDDFSLLTIQF